MRTIKVQDDIYEFLVRTKQITGMTYTTTLKLAITSWRATKEYSKLMLGIRK